MINEIIQHLLNPIAAIILRLRYGGCVRGDSLALSRCTIRLREGGSIQTGECFSVRKNIILNVSAGGVLDIGRDVFMNDCCKINAREHITIGAGCIFGQGVMIYDHDHDYRGNLRNDFVTAPIEIGRETWLGSGVIILKGVHIGERCVIAAGSVVTRDVPSGCLYRNQITPIIKKLDR